MATSSTALPEVSVRGRDASIHRLHAFYPEVFQFVGLEDIVRYSGASHLTRRFSFSGKWHMPKLYLPTLLMPTHLVKIAPEQVHWVDLRSLDVACEQTLKKLRTELAEVEADGSYLIEGIEPFKRILSILVSLSLRTSDSEAFLTAVDSSDLTYARELMTRLCQESDVTASFGCYRFQYQQKWEQLSRCVNLPLLATPAARENSALNAVLWWLKTVFPVIFSKVALGPDFISPLCDNACPTTIPRGLKMLLQRKLYRKDGGASTGGIRILPSDDRMPSLSAIHAQLATHLNISRQMLEVVESDEYDEDEDPNQHSFYWHTLSSRCLVKHTTLSNLDVRELELALSRPTGPLPSAPPLKIQFEILVYQNENTGRQRKKAGNRSVSPIRASEHAGNQWLVLREKSEERRATRTDDFEFSDLRLLETEVLREDLANLHVLAPFRKEKKIHTDQRTRQHCETLIRSVWLKKKKAPPPVCLELLRKPRAREVGGRVQVKLATTATFLERLGKKPLNLRRAKEDRFSQSSVFLQTTSAISSGRAQTAPDSTVKNLKPRRKFSLDAGVGMF